MTGPVFSRRERFAIVERIVVFALGGAVCIWPDLVPWGVGCLLITAASRPFDWERRTDS